MQVVRLAFTSVLCLVYFFENSQNRIETCPDCATLLNKSLQKLFSNSNLNHLNQPGVWVVSESSPLYFSDETVYEDPQCLEPAPWCSSLRSARRPPWTRGHLQGWESWKSWWSSDLESGWFSDWLKAGWWMCMFFGWKGLRIHPHWTHPLVRIREENLPEPSEMIPKFCQY